MATKPLKSLEYMVCISISLASRAAVRGGLDQNKAYTLTDIFLHQLATLKELADYLELSPTYLPHRFSEDVGISIRKYTQKKRIEAAKNMLRFSDTPIERISSYLCFSSQSHFGKVFKDETGMTPLAYRNFQQDDNDPYMTPKELWHLFQ